MAGAADGAEPAWRRTQNALVASVFVWFVGTNFTMPFLPLYVGELGGLSATQAVLWSGLIMSSTPLASGLTAPFWGMLADRFGRRIMLQRSLVGFSIAMALMGIVRAPWQLLLVMTAQGVVGGFSSGAVALVSSVCPPHALTSAVGRIQSARVLGLAVGPLPGGVLADTVGFRGACFVSASAGVLAFVVVTILIPAGAGRPTAAARSSRTGSPWRPLAGLAFAAAFLTVLVTRLVERTFDPVLPALIVQLGPSGLGVASTTALVTSCGLLTSGAAAALVGRVTRRPGVLLCGTVLGAAAVLLALPLAHTWWQLLVARVLVGASAGAAVTLAFSMTARRTPQHRRGATLGLLGAGISYGSFLGFVLAGVLSTVSTVAVFSVDAGILLVVAGLLWVTRDDTARSGRRTA